MLQRSFSKQYSKGTRLEIPYFSHTPAAYNGPSYEDVMRMRKENITSALFHYYSQPPIITEGRMQYMYDHTGKQYLDLIGGICTVGVGHCHPRINEKLHEQVEKLQHHSTVFVNDQMSLYGEELAKKLPEGLDTVFFTSSGSQTNTVATQLAQSYTGNYPIITVKNAYHGHIGARHLSHINSWNENLPKTQGVEIGPYIDMYRGPYADDPEAAAEHYAREIHETIFFGTSGQVAIFLCEPIQGAGGLAPVPQGFLPKAVDHVRAAGGLWLSDEVQTGFGRTGSHYWGWEKYGGGKVPDIISMAKTIGNGLPISALGTTKEIANSLKRITFDTYSSNPLAIVAARETLKIIDDENLQQNSEERGNQFMKGVKELQQIYPQIGQVRGAGMMVGVEFVEDQESKTPLKPEVFAKLHERTKELGVIFGKGGTRGNVFRVQPPMCVTEQDIDFSLDVLDEVLKEINQED